MSECVSDLCRDCGKYEHGTEGKTSFYEDYAYCCGWMDIIAKDAKTARFCTKRTDKKIEKNRW